MFTQLSDRSRLACSAALALSKGTASQFGGKAQSGRRPFFLSRTTREGSEDFSLDSMRATATAVANITFFSGEEVKRETALFLR